MGALKVARPTLLLALRVVNAMVWFGFGFYAKLLGGVPRHQQIVARVLGEQYASFLVTAVGIGEMVIAIWILSARLPRTCAALQTVAIIAMNTLELSLARDLLLSPWGMVCANAGLLTLAWWVALTTFRAKGNA